MGRAANGVTNHLDLGGRYTLHMYMMAAADMCMQCMVRDRAQEIRIWIRKLTKCLPKTFIIMWSPFQGKFLHFLG